MLNDHDDTVFMQTFDPVVERSDCMIRLAAQIDQTRDIAARSLLVSMMDKVLHSITLPKMGELVLLNGGKNDRFQ